MKKLLMFFVISTAGWGTESSDLMPRQQLPNQPPFYNIVVYEVLDSKRGVILKKQEWVHRVWSTTLYFDYNTGQYTRRIVDTAGSKILSERAVVPVAPVAVAPTTVAPTVVATPAPTAVPVLAPPIAPPVPKVEEEAVQEEAYSVVLPVETGLTEFIPERFDEEGPIAIEKRISAPLIKPAALIDIVPLSHRSLRWMGKKPLDESRAESLLETLLRMREGIMQWQQNIRGRFSLCPVDEAQARKDGTKETMYIPWQVSSGRIWIAKTQLDSLIYRLRTDRYQNEEWLRDYMRIVRRIEALETLLELVDKASERPYSQTILSSLEEMQRAGEPYNPLKTRAKKTWALRWQLISEDMQVLIERGDIFSKALTEAQNKKWQTLRNDLQAVYSKIGGHPWTLPIKEQEKLARAIYKPANQVSDSLYKAVAEYTEEDLNPRDRLDIIAVLGAVEGLRLYANTILTIIVKK